MADAREKNALGIKTRRFRINKKYKFCLRVQSSQRDYFLKADKLLTASFSDPWFYSERERSSFSWFVSCSNPKCKVDNHGNKPVKVFVSEGF